MSGLEIRICTFFKILILSIRLIFFFAGNFPSCSIFFSSCKTSVSILMHSYSFSLKEFSFLQTTFAAMLFSAPAHTHWTQKEPACCSIDSLPSLDLWVPSNPELSFLLACFLWGFLLPCLFVFLMIHSIWSRKNKNFITFQGPVTLHFCWLKKYPRKPRHPFASILPLSLSLIWTWSFSKLSFSMFAICCLFGSWVVHLESLALNFLFSV